MSAPDSREMARRGRLGALTTNSRYSGTSLTEKARARFMERFAEQARSEAAERGEHISDDEAWRRGEFLRRRWYAQIAQRPRSENSHACPECGAVHRRRK